MKIALLHDFFEIRGGGERLIITLAKHLGADLIYGFWKPTSYPLEGVHGKSLNAYTSLLGWRTIKQMRAFETLRGLDEYDVVVYSGHDAPFARKNRTKGGNIFYCYTPPRYIYDKKEYYLERQNVITRFLLRLLIRYVQPRYERTVKTMDVLVTSSETIRQRIKRYLGLDAIVVNPPCDTDNFKWIAPGDYYLSTGRLDDLKNIDMIVRAFKAMPDKKLVVVSGGTAERKIHSLANGAPNISFRGWVSDTELQQLLGRCIATVYIPTDEDFGISPVESMAAGKPVIGVASGGLLETVIHKETGILLRPDFTEDHLQEAVAWMTQDQAVSMRTACETRAAHFSRERFLREMDLVIARYK